MRRLLSAFVPLTIFIALASPASAFAATNPAANIGNSINTSLNWSGYVATGGNDTGVSGSWIVPNVTASSLATADATWVGIGGITSHDLIQVGTQAISENGTVSYEAWYELLPADSTPIPLIVRAGDSMTASLAESGTSEWNLSIADNTTGQSYSTAVSYSSSLSSAEWVEEMPTDQNGLIPLDNFSSVSFTGGSLVKNGVSMTPSQANALPLTMITSNDQTLALPSALGADGASFSVARSNVTATVAPHVVRLDGRGGFRRGRGTGSTPPQYVRVTTIPVTLYRLGSFRTNRFTIVYQRSF